MVTVNEIYIGEIVGTHGIKGEVRLISEFREKEYAFLKGKKVYIGEDRKEFTIRTYRHHKKYDMLTFEGIDDINEVIDMRFEKVYMDRKDIELKVPLEEEFVGLDVYFQKENICYIICDYMRYNRYVIYKIYGYSYVFFI